RGRLDGLDDVVVPRAPAEVPLERLADLLVGRIRVPLEDLRGGHDHPGRAVAALERVVLVERTLERVQLSVFGEAFDRLDLAAVGLEGEDRAGLDRAAVEPDSAGAAARRVATDVRPCQAELVAKEMDEQHPRLDLALELPAVDRDPQSLPHVGSTLRPIAPRFNSPAAACAVPPAGRSVRGTSPSRRVGRATRPPCRGA